MSVVALVTDLMFVSKIKGTADALGIPITLVRHADALEQALTEQVRLVIIDLNAESGDPIAAIARCRSAGNPPYVVAFLSHVQRELAAAAQEAGADLVIPRSSLSRDLPQLLQQHSSPGS